MKEELNFEDKDNVLPLLELLKKPKYFDSG
jgi:hypothetical protein